MRVGILYDLETGSEKFQPLFESIKAPLDFHAYEINNGDFPTSPNACDAYIVAGSIKAVYETEPWISRLLEFIKQAYRAERKLIGVCFGHQAVAHALGGHASKSEKGWGLGLKKFKIIKQKPWMEPAPETCKLYFVHQDQVTRLPSGAELLGTSDFCPNNIFCIDNRVLGIQGHPEYTRKNLIRIMAILRQKVPSEVYKDVSDSMNKGIEPDSAIVAQWMLNFLLEPN